MTLDPRFEESYVLKLRRDMALRDGRCTSCLNVWINGVNQDRAASWEWVWLSGFRSLLCDSCCAGWWVAADGDPEMVPALCRALTGAATP